MSLEKILHKIQGQINDIAPTLELFVEDTIQPSADDCEVLQKQLTGLQETLAVYKYNKLMPPSFNIHAKISAQEKVEEKAAAPSPQIKEVVLEEKVKEEPAAMNQPEEPKKPEPVKQRPAMAIGLNDKFRFINELFSQNASEYHIAIEQLSNLQNWQDTEIYLNSLKSLYEWEEKNEVVKHFYSLSKKRFD